MGAIYTWEEYLRKLLSKSLPADTYKITDGQFRGHFPQIVKASILMHEKMVLKEFNRNIFIFPETLKLAPLITIYFYLYLVSKDIVTKQYNLGDFEIGEIIRYKNCRYKYLGIVERNERLYLKLKTSDLDSAEIPIEGLPVFNRSKAQQLSKRSCLYKYSEILEIDEHIQGSENKHQKFYELRKYKGHMSSAILHIGNIGNFKNEVNSLSVNNVELKDLMLFHKGENDGSSKNLFYEGVRGSPSVIVSKNLYSARNIVKNKSINQIIYEITDVNKFNEEFSYLDSLIDNEDPLLVIMNEQAISSISLLKERGFKIWLWDNRSMIPQLIGNVHPNIKSKINNSLRRKIDYEIIYNAEINSVYNVVKAYKEEVKKEQKAANDIFVLIIDLFFRYSRNILSVNSLNIENRHLVLSELLGKLEKEKPYISEKMYEDFKSALNNLKVFQEYELFTKNKNLTSLLNSNIVHGKISLIVDKKIEKDTVIKDFEIYKNNIDILTLADFMRSDIDYYDVCIIPSWFNRDQMKRALFSNRSKKYLLMLFEHENIWRELSQKIWERELDFTDNKIIVDDIFSNQSMLIDSSLFSKKTIDYYDSKIEDAPDEFHEFDNVLRSYKYQEYLGFGSDESGSVISAYPIQFGDSYFGFFGETKKITCITKMILEDSDEIQYKTPKEVELGDYIIIRETDRDLIKDIANNLLENSNLGEARKFSSLWIESLRKHHKQFGFKNLVNCLREHQCKVTKVTIRNWISGEIIRPQKITDLEKAIKAVGSLYLQENVEEIFNAGTDVIRAHVMAGKYLSKQLKKKLSMEEDIFKGENWSEDSDVSEFMVDGIGNTLILRVTNIDSPIELGLSQTNKLFTVEGV